jgi:D-glycero-D-manno-heptose 1,7-bisphosphate phosphatase
MTSGRMRPAVFIDRDGTLIEEAGYLADLDRLAFFPYTVDAVRLLNRGGFAVVILSNQSGIARGIVRREFVEEAHAHIAERLRAGGATLDGVYYCPHHPEGTVASLNRRCACRKPQPGMLLQAAADLQLDLARSFVVGDRWQDVEAAHNAGARGILVRTGHGRREEANGQGTAEPAAVVDDLMAAAAWILGRTDA